MTIRNLAIVCVLIWICGVVYGQSPEVSTVDGTDPGEATKGLMAAAALPYQQPAPTADRSAGSRLDHLLEATAHLAAAGELNRARELWQQAHQELQELSQRLASIEPKLEPKLAEKPRQLPDPTQMVLVKLKLLEIPRAKLQAAALERQQDIHVLSYTETSEESPEWRPLLEFSDTAKLDSVINQLCEGGTARVLAAPSLMSVSGQASTIQSVREVPMFVSDGPRTAVLEQRKLGTEVEILPVALEDQKIRLDIQVQHSEIVSTPGPQSRDQDGDRVRTWKIATRVEMEAGKTLLICGLANRDAGEADSDAAADEAADNDTSDEGSEETELLLLVSAEFVSPSTPSSTANASELEIRR